MHLTDLHLNPLHRIPQSRNSKFHAQIAAKWDRVCSAIKEESIDFGVISGDIFHLKNPKIYCSEDITYYSKLFEKTGIKWVSIPGNHDLPESSYDQIEKSPYNLLVRATDNLNSLESRVKLKDKQEFMFNSFTSSDLEGSKAVPINIHGYPYFPLNTTCQNLEAINKYVGCFEGFNVLLLHMDVLVDPNIFLFWSVAGYDSILDSLPNVDLICLGHIHMSMPVYKRINPKTGRNQLVSKPWSFTRIAKDYFNKTDIYEKLHRPSYSLITIDQSENNFNVGVEYREIPFEPFEKAFKADVLKKQMESNIVIKDFIEEIKKKFGNVTEAFKVMRPEDYLSQIKMTDDVRELFNKYVVD